MARTTPRQKRANSLLAAYRRIKRLQLSRRLRRRDHQQHIHHQNNGSEVSSLASGSCSSFRSTLDSLSSFSLSSISSSLGQGNVTPRIDPGTQTVNTMDTSSDSSLNSHRDPSPPRPCHQGPRGLTYHVRKAISTLYSSRYHVSRKFGHGKPPAFLPTILTTHKDHEEFHHLFRQYLRIDPITFDKLLAAIHSDPVFVNKSRHPQMPIDYQLAITLYRFGHYGNAASLQRVADWAGVGKGTVLVATRRVMTAVLRNSFKDQAVRMPTPEEKEEVKCWVESRSGCPTWRDGWCFVDGTLIPLAFRPFWYGQSYFDRKCNYSLNIQVRSTSSTKVKLTKFFL